MEPLWPLLLYGFLVVVVALAMLAVSRLLGPQHAARGRDLPYESGINPTGSARLLSGTAVHLVAIATLLLVAQLVPDRFYQAVLPNRLSEKLIFLTQPGPGGGGGGNKSPEPPPPAQLKLPAPFSSRRQLLTVSQTPMGNSLKYLSIQAVSSARVLRVPDGTVSHMRVALAEVIPPGFSGWLAPPSL